MNLALLQASKEHEKIIENLMQFYVYDFSEFIGYDVDATGLFARYPGLEKYWEEDDKFPYLIKKDDKYVGFALVRFIRSGKRDYFSMAEFFVLKKYRLTGIGKLMATQIFDLHKGAWEVYQKESNKPAQIFWSKIISAYTKGKFKEHSEDGRRIQVFESN